MKCWRPQTNDDAADGGNSSPAHVQQHPQQQRQECRGSPAVEAWEQGQLTLGFSGGGFLLPYHLGVYHSLEKMQIVSQATPMAGSSAGSLVVGGIKAGISLQQQMDSFLEVAHAAKEGGVQGRLRQLLKAQLLKTMPADAAERCSDSTCWISVTQVFPRPANKLYGAFSSRQQLVKALLASCHLPRLSDGGLLTSSHKGGYKRVFDGGFSNLCPVPPVPYGRQAGHTHDSSSGSAGVSAEPHAPVPAASLLLHQRIDSTRGITTKLLPSKATRTNSISSSSTLHSHGSSSGSATYRRTLSAPDEHASHSLQFSQRTSISIDHHSSSHQSGHSSSIQHPQHTVRGHRGVLLHPQQPAVWARRRHQQQTEQRLAASCEVEGPGAYVAAPGWFAIRVCVLPAAHMHEFPAMFRAPAAGELSIALDKFQEWPHDLNATTALALTPQDDAFLWGLFQRGQQDAASWAQQQGFPAEVLARLDAAGAAAEPEALRVVVGAGSTAGGGSSWRADQQQQVVPPGRSEEEATVATAAQGMQEVREVLLQAHS